MNRVEAGSPQSEVTKNFPLQNSAFFEIVYRLALTKKDQKDNNFGRWFLVGAAFAVYREQLFPSFKNEYAGDKMGPFWGLFEKIAEAILSDELSGLHTVRDIVNAELPLAYDQTKKDLIDNISLSLKMAASTVLHETKNDSQKDVKLVPDVKIGAAFGFFRKQTGEDRVTEEKLEIKFSVFVNIFWLIARELFLSGVTNSSQAQDVAKRLLIKAPQKDRDDLVTQIADAIIAVDSIQY